MSSISSDNIVWYICHKILQIGLRVTYRYNDIRLHWDQYNIISINHWQSATLFDKWRTHKSFQNPGMIFIIIWHGSENTIIQIILCSKILEPIKACRITIILRIHKCNSMGSFLTWIDISGSCEWRVTSTSLIYFRKLIWLAKPWERNFR